MAPARYDGHADWYDPTFGFLGAETGSGGLLGHLLGPAERDGQVCLDVGCGTGRHFRAAQASGYTVLGVDLSADQLRVAAHPQPPPGTGRGRTPAAARRLDRRRRDDVRAHGR